MNPPDSPTEGPQTWHHGLMARYWAERLHADDDELAYYAGAIERFGEPALDLCCGAGRILVPLLERGLDVVGVDVSADMLARSRQLASDRGLQPTLTQQAMHALDLPRTYRTIFICDSFGIGGGRHEALAALLRIHAHLAPGGALVFSHDLPYADDEAEWLRWLPGRRRGTPEPWPSSNERQALDGGEEVELITRERSFDPLRQETVLDLRARLWRGDHIVAQEEHAIVLPAFFAQEVTLLLEAAGFDDIEIQGRYTGRPASADDATVVFVAQRRS